MPQYKHFQVRHPEHNEPFWAKCRAFYAGGERLLSDRKLLRQVFPPHLAEEDFVYRERVARAFYIPYAGEIIDAIIAALFAESLTVQAKNAIDPYYDVFVEDVSPPKGRKQSLSELLRHQMLTALLCRRAWTLVDLPDLPGDQPAPETRAEEEALGLGNAYACTVDPEMVLDWEETEDGEILWAVVLHRERKRKSIESLRKTVREEYTIYSPEHWERYFIEYSADKLPEPNTELMLMDEGVHSFGRVPLIRMELSEGLWAMSKILPIAVAHFNKRNALSWAEYKSLFPVLAAFQAPEDILNPATEDPDRALNQRYGQGRITVFGASDRLEYIGPDSGPFGAAMADLNGLRDEMHRVLHHMALSVDNSAAALQRSAESKQIDQAATAVILRALGKDVRAHAVEILETVATGRGEIVEWVVEGMERFNEQSVDALVDQATAVDAISIPSATFKRRWTYMVARRLLGENATPGDLEAIAAELEMNVSNEQYTALPPMVLPRLDEDEGKGNGADNGADRDGEAYQAE